MSNRDYKNMENKYYLIGFILGLIPYLIIIFASKLLDAPTSFIEVLTLFGIITAIINGKVLRKQIIIFNNKRGF